MEFIIKAMETENEIRGKAYVHWKSWQESYRGIVDAEYLAGMTLAQTEEKAFRWLDNLLVAKDGERVVGFVGYGAARGVEDAGEIYALYVLEEYQKQGIGYALIKQALSQLAGCRVVYLWALKDNQKAIHFYERVGFRADGAEKEIVLGTPVKGIRMAMPLQPLYSH